VHEVLRWADEFYTEEVYILGSAGMENVDYVIDGDGTWRMTAAAQNNTYFSGDVLISSGPAVPGLASEAFQRRYYDTTVNFISDQLGIINAVAERPFPYYSLTFAQEAEIAPLQMKIGRLVDESIGRWITGETLIDDESFSNFEKELKEAGLEDFMAFWQNILDGRTSK
jgi:hypothetical protein